MKKSALVMGFDNSVIARESILLLINEGYYVVAGYEGDSINREKFVEDNGISSKIEFVQINYSSGETVNTFISQVSSREYTAIVNCYATLAETADKGLRHEFFDFDYVEFSRVMNANVTAIAAVVIGLKDNIVENGCIVNVTSSAAFEGAFATISYNASKTAGEYAADMLKEKYGEVKGNVIVLSYPALETMNQRNEGFIEALKEYPDVTIKEETVEECTAEGGQKLTDNLLIANPEGTLDIIYGSNAGVALGALASVSSAGREDIALVGIDNEEGQLNALKDGRYYKATVAQDSYSIGEEAMNAALSAIDGKKTGDVVVPGILVTADNVEEYLTDDQAKKDELEEYK